MKKLLLILVLCLMLCSAQSVWAEEGFELLPEIEWVEDPIEFKDPKLEEAICKILNKDAGPIYPGEVQDITELNLAYKGIEDITGLEAFTGLQKLELHDNKISSLDPLEG